MNRSAIIPLNIINASFRSPFVTIFIIAAFIFSCQKAGEPKKEAKPAVTIDNLQTAYGKEVNQQKMYELFVKQAEKEHLKNMASLYRAVALSEGVHAASHAKLLLSQSVQPALPASASVVVGNTMQTLKMALSSEDIEFDSMYPNLIRSADAEKYAEASTKFKNLRDSDARHAELFRNAVDKAGKITAVNYFICPECGYILTSDKTDECPICHTKKDRFEKI